MNRECGSGSKRMESRGGWLGSESKGNGEQHLFLLIVASIPKEGRKKRRGKSNRNKTQ